MSWLQQLAEKLAGLKFWYCVRPWERAVRVRCGRWAEQTGPGLRLRIPFLDEVFVQNIRQRVLNLPVQTVTTRDGKTITISGVVNWSIADVLKMYQQLHAPEDWILNTVLAAIAETLSTAEGELTPATVGAAATLRLADDAKARVGLAIEGVTITDMARVRTYRLITGEGNSIYNCYRIGALDTATK
jgi:regulator of protease activity HflC (stomatin/prohibitin superfamily)